MDKNTSDEPEGTQASDKAEKQEELHTPKENKEPERAEHEEANKQYKEAPSKISLWKEKASAFIKECIRVLKITKKPDKAEFATIVKVSGIGILIIGLIGFLVFLIKEVIL